MPRGKQREIHNVFGVNKKGKKVCGKKCAGINDTKITCKSKFTASSRFMPKSLSTLVDNLADEIYKNKCKDCKDKCSECMPENWKMKYRDCEWNLAYVEF